MGQTKQLKKVKLYRTLKVVFYFLGLPLFIFAVFCTAIKFMGEDPFVGTASLTPPLGFFIGYERFITSPALFGIWCAVGVWALISLCHIVLAKVVKSRRARMFAVLAIVLVVMLGGTFLMDVAFDASIDKIIAAAEDGVVVQDYQSQLSYYGHVSYARKKNDLVKQLKTKVQLLENVYNVEWEGIDKSGIAGNISNKPIDYYSIISDPYTDEDGVTRVDVGVDISFAKNETTGGYDLQFDENGNIVPGDGLPTPEVEGQQLVRLAPNGKGELVINGRTYSHYYCVTRTAMNGTTTYLWYAKDLHSLGTEFKDNGTAMHKAMDGVYGKGLYNESGLLADGWIFSFENVLEILEDYYEGQAELAAIQVAANAVGIPGYYENEFSAVVNRAKEIRDDYYNGLIPLPSTEVYDEEGNLTGGQYVDPWVTALYNQEVKFTEDFSLTRGELEYLLSHVGALLGDNSLFDWLFGTNVSSLGDLIGSFNIPVVGDIIGPLLGNLGEGISLSALIDNEKTMGTVIKTVKSVLDRTDEQINDLFLVLVYKNTDKPNAVIKKDHLYIALRKDNGKQKQGGGWEMDTTDDGLLLDIDFDDGLLEGGGKDEYNFDFDRLSTFLNTALQGLLDNMLGLSTDKGIGKTVLDLVLQDIDVDGVTYRGLVISGISIPLLDSSGKFAIDVNGILTRLLKNWYSYQSPVIKPIWEFYEEVETDDEVDEIRAAIKASLAKYERALYEATTYGSMIGSTLIGDSLGAGTYASSFGLGDLTSVRQLKTDLSYQRNYFPLYSFRDMLLMFSGIVVLFYFLSFVAAEKEELYATGKLLGKVTKSELEKELEGAPASPDPDDVTFETPPEDEDADGYDDGYDEPDESEEGEKTPDDQNNIGEVK